MSSTAHSIAKKIKKNNLLFDEDMYSNVFGSIAISAYILAEDKTNIDPKELSKKFKSIVKSKQAPVALNDPDFVNKVLDFYGIISKPKMTDLALVIYKANAVIAPYIDGHLYPLREDGFIGNIISSGKIYPLKNASLKTEATK